MSHNHEFPGLVRLCLTRAASVRLGVEGPLRLKTALVTTSVSGSKADFPPSSAMCSRRSWCSLLPPAEEAQDGLVECDGILQKREMADI